MLHIVITLLYKFSLDQSRQGIILLEDNEEYKWMKPYVNNKIFTWLFHLIFFQESFNDVHMGILVMYEGLD